MPIMLATYSTNKIIVQNDIFAKKENEKINKY